MPRPAKVARSSWSGHLPVTIPVGQDVHPLPEGDRYLGFLFAEAATYQEVQEALRTTRTVTAQVLLALAWSAAIIAVFAPLAVRLYRRTVS